MILEIFSSNKLAKIAFLTLNSAKLCKMLIITLVFEKNANFFAENYRKSQKIVIITSTLGRGRRALHRRCCRHHPPVVQQQQRRLRHRVDPAGLAGPGFHHGFHRLPSAGCQSGAYPTK
jgi:hypothetical protein